MNDKAHRLGMENTHFSNPNGLDAPNHYSTAKDLAILTSYAMADPVFAKIVSTRQIRIGERYLTNHNKLLWRLEGADGVKTGFTKAAGRILVSSAVRQGRRLVCVTMNAPDDWNDHQELMELGFRDYSLRRVIDAGVAVGTCQVLGGDPSEVELLTDTEFLYALTEQEHPRVVTGGQSFVYAPVVEGADAGVGYVMLGDVCIGTVPLVYGQTVEQKKEENRSIWDRWFGGQ
jgi:D-alanyl-D-alanine carboxypeptidase